tara:strand:+ start:9574 stop:10251 length:678 start_codon:yes stop_codon:yes gene_type:complete
MISTIDISFTDSFGNMKPNNTQKDSENPSTCNAAYWLMREHAEGHIEDKYVMELNRQKWLTNGRYMTNENDVHKIAEAEKNNERSPNRFSLDEAISVASVSRRYKHYENLSRIELFGRSYSLRPDTFSYLLLCKFPIFNLLLIPRFFVSLSMVIGCMRKPSDTSGKQLSYIRYRGLNMNLTWWLCKKVLTNKNPTAFFKIWYPSYKNTDNQTHLTCKNAEKIWGE